MAFEVDINSVSSIPSIKKKAIEVDAGSVSSISKFEVSPSEVEILKPLIEIPRETMGYSSRLAMSMINPNEYIKEISRFARGEKIPEVEKRSHQALGTAGIHYWNTRFFGLPLYGLKKLGYKFEDPETIEETIAGAVGDLGGFISGPGRYGKMISSKIPVIGRVYNLATTKTQAIIKPILRSALSLGTAFGLMTPDEGLLAPEARLRQFGSGATMGAAFGVLGFVPSTPLRTLMASAYVGRPWDKEAREQPLEMQIFNYGLGAYYGFKGRTRPSELLAQESKLARYMREGVDYKEVPVVLGRAANDLKVFKLAAKDFGPDPEPAIFKLNRVLKAHGTGYYDPMKDIIAKESFKIQARPVEQPVIPKPKIFKDWFLMPTFIKGNATLETKYNEYIGSHYTYQVFGEKSNTLARKAQLISAMEQGGFSKKNIDYVIKKGNIAIKAIKKEGIAERITTPAIDAAQDIISVKKPKLPKKQRAVDEVKLFEAEKIPTPKASKGYYTPPRLPERGRDYVYGVKLKDGTVLKGLPKDANHTSVMYRYKSQSDKGLIKQIGIVDLKSGRLLVGDSEIAFKGRAISEVLTKADKAKIKEKRIKQWRNETTSKLHRQLFEIEKAPEFNHRSDDIRYVISQVSSSEKALEKLTNTELYNIEQTLLHSEKPSVKLFDSRPPTKSGTLTGGKIQWWDVFNRKGYGLLQKLGYGNEYESGLTNQYAMAEVRERSFNRKYIELSNNWKQLVGMNKETSKKLFNYVNGTLHKNHLSPKEFAVAKQMQSYLGTCLEIYNRHLAAYGEPPIKGIANYITHIFDNSLWISPDTGRPIPRQQFLDNKYPFPEHLENVLHWITPKAKTTPFAKARKGGLGYVEDIWRALDTYTHHIAQSVNDDPVRRSFANVSFLRREMDINKNTGKQSVIDLSGIAEQTKRFAQDYIGRPGAYDKYIRNSINTINKVLPDSMKIHSVVSLSNAVTTLIYGTQMSYRLKTAIRNMGQQSLIIARTGFKPLGWAYKMVGNKSFKGPDGKTYTTHGILNDSWVLKSRPGAYAPESTAMDASKFVSMGMRPFAKADLFNVRTAYLAGFKYGMSKGGTYKDWAKSGNEVAGMTQFIYLRGNRSMLARGMGVSKSLGRMASIFTTWPSNYLEFIISSAAPEHRVNLMKYMATVAGMTVALRAAGIRGEVYTGLNSLKGVWDLYTGKLPISGIIESPSIQSVNDLMKGMDKDLLEALFYTYNREVT